MNKRPTTQITLMIRIIVAMYLIYLAHGLITGLDTAPNPRMMVVIAVIFTFAGVLIIAFVVKAFINREYTDMREISAGEDREDDKTDDKPTEGTVIDESVTDEGIENNKDLETDNKDE